MDDDAKFISKLAGGILIILGGLIVLGMWGCPKYNVYSSEKDGEATYAKAAKDREVKVLEAQAKLDAAKLEAQAEIERAKGVAGANAIIADGLKGNEDYLRYLWIDKVAGNTAREIVYVPTEANLPILEAGKTAK
jgi:regulator of protease activity HflC (stomatin/prohibitin superfamily)